MQTWSSLYYCLISFIYIDEKFHVQDDYEYISLDCDNKCSNQTDVNVVWNIHLLSQNYNITVQCQNDSCTGINNYTKLLNIEQEFIMKDSSLGYLSDFLYEDALVGCIATADNCTENHFWRVKNLGIYTFYVLYVFICLCIFCIKGLTVGLMQESLAQ